jgi:hypothetical protein
MGVGLAQHTQINKHSTSQKWNQGQYHMIILRDTEKDFGSILYSYIIKALKMLGI